MNTTARWNSFLSDLIFFNLMLCCVHVDAMSNLKLGDLKNKVKLLEEQLASIEAMLMLIGHVEDNAYSKN